MKLLALVSLVFVACHPAPPPAKKASEPCKESIELLLDHGRAECPPGTVLHAKAMSASGHAIMIASCDCPAEEEVQAPQTPTLPRAPTPPGTSF